MSHNDVRPCNLGFSSSNAPGGPSFYMFDMGHSTSWPAKKGITLPAHGLYSSCEMLLKGRPAPFSNFQSLLFTALDVSGCKLPWAEAAKRWGDFGAMTMRYELLEDPEGSSVLASWPQHLRHFAARIFRAATLPLKQQQQMVADVGLWLRELRFSVKGASSGRADTASITLSFRACFRACVCKKYVMFLHI